MLADVSTIEQFTRNFEVEVIVFEATFTMASLYSKKDDDVYLTL